MNCINTFLTYSSTFIFAKWKLSTNGRRESLFETLPLSFLEILHRAVQLFTNHNLKKKNIEAIFGSSE